MSRFQRIVRVREIWEKQARSQLGEANRRLSDARTAAETAADDHRRSLDSTPERAGGDGLELWRLAAMATRERHHDAATVRDQTSDRHRAAQGAWRHAAQQMDMARSLEDRRQQALAYAARRAADASLDELMAIRRRPS